MFRCGRRFSAWVSVVLSLLVSSCGWLDRAAGNPKQEAHYMEGENLRRTAQYVAAREAYQKAIEVNPANYFAHQELGDLYYQHFNDPGTALYHYRRYLEIGQRINGRSFTDPTTETCIQGSEFKLAERVVAQLARQRSTVEVDQLKRENDSLRQQLTEAQRQLQIRALEARNAPAPVTNAPSGNVPPTGANQWHVPNPATNPIGSRAPTNPPPDSARARENLPPALRSYTIKAGDNPATIARAYGIKLQTLLDANPGLDPRRLRVGQTIRVPAR